MRVLALAFALTFSGPALAQSLNASLPSGLNGVLFGSLQGGIQSGFRTDVGPRQGPLMPGQTFDYTDFTAQQQLQQLGFSLGGCAPTQLDRNHSGCRPIREFQSARPSAYDQSIQAMGPLGGLTLQGQTLAQEPGPAGPLE